MVKVIVHRGALLLVPQWQCISSFVFYTGVILKGPISRVCIPNINILSLMVQKLWTRLKLLFFLAIVIHKQNKNQMPAISYWVITILLLFTGMIVLH